MVVEKKYKVMRHFCLLFHSNDLEFCVFSRSDGRGLERGLDLFYQVKLISISEKNEGYIKKHDL